VDEEESIPLETWNACEHHHGGSHFRTAIRCPRPCAHSEQTDPSRMAKPRRPLV